MTTPLHILVVDDDDRIRQLLARYLRQEGMVVSTAQHAAHARQVLRLFRPDLAVVDVMMPGEEDGVGLAAFLRESLDLPVILLTAMGEAGDRIKGLEAGADDYVVKPFEPKELLLRIQAVLRRHTGGQPAVLQGEKLSFGGYVYDRAASTLVHATQGPVPLSDSEQALLRALSERPNVPLRREALVHALNLKGQERTIDVQIGRLRKKLGDDGAEPQWLLTIRGKGYMLKAESHV